MSRKIIIHGGMPKTGTTSLQNALHALRDPLLKSQGLLYPSVGPNHSHALRTLFLNDPSEHIQYKLTGKIDTIAADQQRYRDTLRREIEGSDWQTLLFSGEGVSNMKGEEIARMHDWLGQYSDDLSLFYWVRDPVKHAVSIIQQTLKSGQVLEERFQNPPLPSWEKRLGPGREVFGANKTWIRDFDAAIRGEDGIFGAFAGDIGLTGENRQMFIDAGARDNESLSHEAALILSAINQQYPALVDGKPGPMRSAREVGLLRRIKGQKFTVPYGVLRKCHKRTRDDVVWLNETFGTALYLDPMPEKPTGGEKPLLFDVATVKSLSRVMVQMLADNRVLKLQIEALELIADGKRRAAGDRLKEALRIDPGNADVTALLETCEKKRLLGR